MPENEFIGKNSLDNVHFLIDENKIKKILIFAGKNSFFDSGAEDLLKKSLVETKYEIFYKTKKYPDLSELYLANKCINDFKPNLIIAIGGGSVLDLAKSSNVVCLINDIKTKIQSGKLNIKKKFCKLVAIPTTAGSGAEVTSNAVLYIDKKKYSIEDKLIKPDYAIIDPHLIMSVPKEISASSGIDAFSQALESLVSVRSNDESMAYAIKSLEYSNNYLIKHINEKTLETSHKMLLAAFYSGKAINISKTTAPHSLSYPFTSYFGVRHGHAVSLTLTDFFKFNFKNIKYSKSSFNLKDRYNKIFNLFNIKSINELENKIDLIIKNIGLTKNIREFNIKSSSDINLILENVNFERLSNNPVELKIGDLKDILIPKIK